jgi:hypothetical protein
VISAYTRPESETVVFLAQDQTAKLFEVAEGRRSACLIRAVPDPDSQSRIFAGSHTIAMKQSEQKNRRRLTGLDTGLTLAIPERGQDGFVSERENLSGFESDDFRIHSRNVYVSLLLRRNAGVFHGVSSEANSGSLQPTRHEARWVFVFLGDSLRDFGFFRAPVAKWLTRGSAKPVFAGSIPARCSSS